MSKVTFMPVIDYTPTKMDLDKGLMSESQALAEIKSHSSLHKQKMSAYDFQEAINILETSFDSLGNLYNDYDKAALARIVSENFLRFDPDVTLPSVVSEYVKETKSISSDYRGYYEAKLVELRAKYLEPEKQTLIKASIPEIVLNNKENLSHPMLKYGLLKGKR